ncbi:MAG: hypothetical protein HEP71_34355 [Roseivirga sp.]|nr:hypothetical protein [Roseivirga sp.]
MFFLITISLSLNLQGQQWSLSEVGTLPEAVSNNAICEGLVGDSPFVFSFGGLDKTKIYTGIHLRSFRFNTLSGKSERIPDLPDTLGKVAAGASNVKGKIYIIGGYHVFSNGSELSSNKVHRYDPQSNSYLTDGTPVPVAIDDHVQAVWRDSLIYVITGWSDKANVPAVQIYNPAKDRWMTGTSTPDDHQYKSFGASGVIRGDTIFYFGGASMGKNFPIQNQLRVGIINPENPAEIEWSVETPDEQITGYRMASVLVDEQVQWLGGSEVTYNYNGIAYNKTGGVPPAGRVLILDSTQNPKLTYMKVSGLPMDLRGIASISNSVKYLAGGMLAGQEVTNKIFKLEWKK